MNHKSTVLLVAALFCAAASFAQERARPPGRQPAGGVARSVPPGPKTVGDYSSDVVVVRDAQEQALEQVRALLEGIDDPRGKALMEAVEKEMARAAEQLRHAAGDGSAAGLEPALAAEQTAYQALLKLAAHEYRVSRSRNQSGGQGGGNMQRQLDMLDLKQAENRYETQSQASPQQNAQQREQLQVLNRLKELAQRQQDLNGRIKELQTALQEAKTDEEREEIRRRLKRLREEEQEMLADLDELGQRMDRPENQSRMADSRQQLDKTRSDVQRASEALDKESVPQALTSGTRAQRELQQLSDDFRKKSSSRFTDEMRQMRNDARELAQKQEALANQLDSLADSKHKTLSDSDERAELAKQMAQQKAGLTNLLNEMRGVSEQSETAEPLLSRQLYDTLRQSNQDELDKSLDMSAELVQRGFVPQAGQFERRARQSIDELKRGVEKAAESVLGNDIDALRLARRELETLSSQLENEIARAGTNAVSTNIDLAASGGELMRRRYGLVVREPSPTPGTTNEAAGARDGTEAPSNAGRQPSLANRDNRRSTDQGPAPGEQSGRDGKAPNLQSRNGESDSRQGSSAQQQKGTSNSPGDESGSSGGQQAAQPGSPQDGQASSAGGTSIDGRNPSGSRSGANRRNFFDQSGGAEGGGAGGLYVDGPLTGNQFVDWSDRLRDVEEMIDAPELRTEVARIRERARAARLDYKRRGQKPDWAVVRLQIATPLADVRSRISEELARRESNEAVVPIDRDPVPAKFSELVRRYYEQLGKSE